MVAVSSRDLIIHFRVCGIDQDFVKTTVGRTRRMNALSQSFLMSFTPFVGRRLPMSQPQPRSVLTTLGVTAAVKGTLTKIKLLCTA